jgi:hypothetical protein
MRAAYLPVETKWIEARDYGKQIGSLAAGGVAEAPSKVICRVCGHQLEHRAATAQRVAHFKHPAKSGFCATKISAAEPYISLTPVERDSIAAANIQRRFRQTRPAANRDPVTTCLTIF